jgi:hypothetical protein
VIQLSNVAVEPLGSRSRPPPRDCPSSDRARTADPRSRVLNPRRLLSAARPRRSRSSARASAPARPSRSTASPPSLAEHGHREPPRRAGDDRRRSRAGAHDLLVTDRDGNQTGSRGCVSITGPATRVTARARTYTLTAYAVCACRRCAPPESIGPRPAARANAPLPSNHRATALARSSRSPGTRPLHHASPQGDRTTAVAARAAAQRPVELARESIRRRTGGMSPVGLATYPCSAFSRSVARSLRTPPTCSQRCRSSGPCRCASRPGRR